MVLFGCYLPNSDDNRSLYSTLNSFLVSTESGNPPSCWHKSQVPISRLFNKQWLYRQARFIASHTQLLNSFASSGQLLSGSPGWVSTAIRINATPFAQHTMYSPWKTKIQRYGRFEFQWERILVRFQPAPRPHVAGYFPCSRSVQRVDKVKRHWYVSWTFRLTKRFSISCIARHKTSISLLS